MMAQKSRIDIQGPVWEAKRMHLNEGLGKPKQEEESMSRKKLTNRLLATVLCSAMVTTTAFAGVPAAETPENSGGGVPRQL